MAMPSRVAFSIFGFEIYWYGICITTGILAGILMSIHRAKHYSVSKETVLDYALVTIPAAIVGLRLFYVAFNFQEFSGDILAILDFRRGGLAIYGGIIAAVIAAALLSYKKKISILQICDIAIPTVALGQAIGRWGNFFNQEAYGELVTNPALQFFPYAVYIENRANWFMAAFFYESVSCLIIFLFLSWYTKRSKQSGNVALWYAVLYGIERAFVEGIRQDSLYLGNVRISQAISIVLVAVCGGALFARWVIRRRSIVVEDPSLRIHARDESLEESGTQPGEDNEK